MLIGYNNCKISVVAKPSWEEQLKSQRSQIVLLCKEGYSYSWAYYSVDTSLAQLQLITAPNVVLDPSLSRFIKSAHITLKIIGLACVCV